MSKCLNRTCKLKLQVIGFCFDHMGTCWFISNGRRVQALQALPVRQMCWNLGTGCTALDPPGDDAKLCRRVDLKAQRMQNLAEFLRFFVSPLELLGVVHNARCCGEV